MIQDGGFITHVVIDAVPGIKKSQVNALYTEQKIVVSVLGKHYEEIKNTVYHGYYDKSFSDTNVTVKKDEQTEKLRLRLDLGKYSPTGFAWGYGGSGPRQLAVAILADFFGDESAEKYSNMFKWDIIARFPKSPHAFDLTGHQILEWASVHQVPATKMLQEKYGEKVLIE